MCSTMARNCGQDDVIAAMSEGVFYGDGGLAVERIETHAAIIFLAGDDVFKIKKAVKYAYMDLSTLEKRHRLCLREYELNAPGAPDIYLDVIAVTREHDGSFCLGGECTGKAGFRQPSEKAQFPRLLFSLSRSLVRAVPMEPYCFL